MAKSISWSVNSVNILMGSLVSWGALFLGVHRRVAANSSLKGLLVINVLCNPEATVL